MFYFLDSLLPIDTEEFAGFPKIYDGASAVIPEGFNAVKVKLNGHLESNLDWKNELQFAEQMISQNYRLFWELDLGLFNLRWPLQDQTQFLALSLSVSHFRDTVWIKFAPNTCGISLYRGSIDFSKGSENPIKARDEAFDYIKLLAHNLPSDAPISILFETKSVQDPLLLAMLLHPEESRGLARAMTEDPLPWSAFQTSLQGYLSEQPYSDLHEELPTIGICLPSQHLYDQKGHHLFREAIKKLDKPYRFLSEAFLTSEWQGLDFLLVVPEWISEQGRRKLRGFCAAGGTVVTLGASLGLPQETSFSQWMQP